MPRTLQLAVVGTAAGLFSGLFGVGGGAVMVPLLVLWLGYGEREATGTSLAAIAVIATVAGAAQARYGNVDYGRGALIGVLAAGGSYAGVALANVVPERALELTFAGLALLVAAQLTRRALSAPGEPTTGGG
jgi:uncharacterized membrane protein YfcA